MKKITFFILTIFTVATLFAAARPSLDGRAVVADSGTMPRGLFARTVGYLPGDSVTVTNPATGSTVDVLILGAIDPSEGVAILLSPEAAEGLRIKPESNVQVKLTKRSGSLDENANGSAVLSDGSNVIDSGESSLAAAEEVAAENPVVTEPEPNYEEYAVTPEYSEPVAQKTAYEEVPVLAKKEPVKEPVLEEKAEVIPAAPVKIEEKNPVEEVRVLPDVYEELPAIKDDELEYKDMQKVVILEEKNEASLPEPVLADENLVMEKVPALEDKNENLQPVVILAEDLPADVEELTPVTDEIPDTIEEEPAVVATGNEGDVYQPIILVPAEPNPPVAGEVEESPVEESAALIAQSEEKTESPAEESIPAPVTLAAEKVETLPVAVEKKVPAPVSNDWTNYVVPSLKNLRSGSYYVQVASLGNAENIKSFVDKYSAKYPVVLVQNAAKTGYQVMVGPLNIDEYGSVDEKFKAYGFKDSFIRKIR
ncbi:MAG: SPOR domain-containing protein [Treponema sp.]|nr:SPOR domain-containing protein [Treponema sp.]